MFFHRQTQTFSQRAHAKLSDEPDVSSERGRGARAIGSATTNRLANTRYAGFAIAQNASGSRDAVEFDIAVDITDDANRRAIERNFFNHRSLSFSPQRD